MPGMDPLSRRAASNLVAVEMDLAVATAEGDTDRVRLLQTLISSGGQILLYRPQLQHYAVLFGEIPRFGGQMAQDAARGRNEFQGLHGYLPAAF